MLPFGDMASPLREMGDRSVEVSGVFGAENASATPFKLMVSKQKLLDLFCQNAEIARQLRKQA
jgi:hypothetical protein